MTGCSLSGWWGFSLISPVTEPREASIIWICAVEGRKACFHRAEYSYLAKPGCLCMAKPGLPVSHRTEDSSATEVIPALIGSRWVSWSPAILRDSSVFGRSLLPGPLLQRIWCKQPIRLHQHFPQILPVRRLQPLPAVLSERVLWRRTVTTSPWKRNQKKRAQNHKEKEKGELAKILKEPHLHRLQEKNHFCLVKGLSWSTYVWIYG